MSWVDYKGNADKEGSHAADAFSIASRFGSTQSFDHGIEPQFTACCREVNAGVPVQFIDISAGEPEGWRWLFGDGYSSENQNPSHTYGTPGKYTVELEAHFKGGSVTETKEDYVTVLPAGSP